ncbi:hypothetical protein CAOG_06171 [Capsaspora owczarzaki ATCC 30864]|uniref:hypothetical protein n=1 Tax=Capsaspora owczarzaki (strain ATCC 30864) TaxID=595528 RepID=UPI0003525EA7|nr:hypothetical protein CAOG_06171 [Capsaspora owczarzaki ATCC 30864]|eukprot:XP_004345761.2 hypothetical protein CAOG_06171 [Capsaspora owczarzaki ATCC 30864]
MVTRRQLRAKQASDSQPNPKSNDANSDSHSETPSSSSSFWPALASRCTILVGLLLLQSLSGSIMEHYAGLLQSHVAVMFFLTTIVGAGGNVGNQSAVAVIRGLATGEIHAGNRLKLVLREAVAGVVIAAVAAGFKIARILILSPSTAFNDVTAIVVALAAVVCLSSTIGTLLPLALDAVGVDPAHAGPTIQVVMDILGVLITCAVSESIFAVEAITVESQLSAAKEL